MNKYQPTSAGQHRSQSTGTMGIRFRCPKGHQLHVKSFLAGKKGVCPDCGARVRIPLESTITKDGSDVTAGGSGKKDDDEDTQEIPPETPAMKSGEDLRDAAPIPQGTAPPQTQAPLNVPSGTSVAGANVAATSVAGAQPKPIPVGQSAPAMGQAVTSVPTGMQAVPTGSNVPAGGMPTGVASTAMSTAPGMGVVRAVTPVGGPVMGQPVTVGAAVSAPGMPRPVVAAGSPLPPGLVDPITESPNAVWYVRPTTGGQYGPARGDAFRQWLSQGRVAADSLVWREGWADWKSASEVFPELARSTPGVSMPPTAASTGGSNVSGVTAATTTASYKARRRNSSLIGIMLMVLLAVVCIGLIGALIYVLPKT